VSGAAPHPRGAPGRAPVAVHPGLAAVVFDVDGTLVDSERQGHRVAFNLAFEEAGLPYRWDEEAYGELLRITGGQQRIADYLDDQGVDEDRRQALVPALHARKTAIMRELVAGGRIAVRPGARRLVDELARAGVRLAVATTGSRGWVDELLEHLLPGVAFEVVVCGDDVAARKPDPEAYLDVLRGLDADPAGVVVLEDSEEGLVAARAARLAVVVVVNGYTAGHDLTGADLVLDGFGEPSRPARVVADPHGTGCAGVLDAATVAAIARTRLGGGEHPSG